MLMSGQETTTMPRALAQLICYLQTNEIPLPSCTWPPLPMDAKTFSGSSVHVMVDGRVYPGGVVREDVLSVEGASYHGLKVGDPMPGSLPHPPPESDTAYTKGTVFCRSGRDAAGSS